MEISSVAYLKDLPSSTIVIILMFSMLCKLSKQGCLSPLSSRQSFCLLMTVVGIFGVKLFI